MLTLVSDLRNMSIGLLLRLNLQRAEKEAPGDSEMDEVQGGRDRR